MMKAQCWSGNRRESERSGFRGDGDRVKDIRIGGVLMQEQGYWWKITGKMCEDEIRGECGGER